MDRLAWVSLLASLATIFGLGIAAWQFRVAMEKDAEARLLQVELVLQEIDSELIARVSSIDRLRSEIALLDPRDSAAANLSVHLGHEIVSLDSYVMSLDGLSRALDDVAPRLAKIVFEMCEYLGERDFMAGEFTDQFLSRSQDVCARI